MNTIPWLESVHELSGFEFSFLILMIIITAMATGFAIDAIMHDMAMGPTLNAALAVIGVCTGIYLRYRYFAPYRADDLPLTLGCAIGFAFIVFLALGLVKSRA